MTKTERRKEWELRLAAFQASGQSASAWCAANDLKLHQLWYWLRKHQSTDTHSVTPSQWLSVNVSDTELQNQNNALLIRVGQATIEVKQGFNPVLLSDVVGILAHYAK